jgi:hypothetical protein
MKLLKYILFHALISAWTFASAQEKATALPLEEKPAQETKKAEKKTDTVPVQTDKKGQTYKMVDGRKVLVDSQGNQSLVNPEQTETKTQKEKATK